MKRRAIDFNLDVEEPEPPPRYVTPRKEHLAWCKQRALEYVDMGDLEGAFGSLTSDLARNQLLLMRWRFK